MGNTFFIICFFSPLKHVKYRRGKFYKCLGIVRKDRYLKVYSGIYIFPLNWPLFLGDPFSFASLFREINKENIFQDELQLLK